MEANQTANDTENLQTPQKKDDKRKNRRQEDSNQSRVSGSRRTRSQVAPDWTLKDALILVNEYAAVQADCSNALSTFQKWKIIAENCAALDVSRTLNQCRRKWDSLLDEYRKIKQWESRARTHSYCSLETERRKKLGLPEHFDSDLFKAIDDLVRAREDQSDTDPDIDPEADADMHDVIAELGSKRQRRQSTLLKSVANEKLLKSCIEEEPQRSHTQEKPQKCRAEEKPQDSHVEEKTLKSHIEEQKIISLEEQQQMMVVKLRENAELIHAIVKGNVAMNADYGSGDSKNVEDFQTDFARRQADQLIACLGDIVNTLDQIGLVQECE